MPAVPFLYFCHQTSDPSPAVSSSPLRPAARALLGARLSLTAHTYLCPPVDKLQPAHLSLCTPPHPRLPSVSTLAGQTFPCMWTVARAPLLGASVLELTKKRMCCLEKSQGQVQHHQNQRMAGDFRARAPGGNRGRSLNLGQRIRPSAEKPPCEGGGPGCRPCWGSEIPPAAQ